MRGMMLSLVKKHFIDYSRVTNTFFIPFREDLIRFDWEVDQEDEPLLGFGDIL